MELPKPPPKPKKYLVATKNMPYTKGIYLIVAEALIEAGDDQRLWLKIDGKPHSHYPVLASPNGDRNWAAQVLVQLSKTSKIELWSTTKVKAAEIKIGYPLIDELANNSPPEIKIGYPEPPPPQKPKPEPTFGPGTRQLELE